MKALMVLLALVASLITSEVVACQKYAANVQDSAGNIVPSALVTVTLFNAATLATIYSDPLCATTIANPLPVTSDGSFVFYAQDGHYSLAFAASGYALVPVLDVAIFEPFGNNVKSVAEFPTPSDVCAPATGAIAQTGATVRTLYVNAAVACSVTSAAPSTLSWVFLGTGSLTVSAGQSLTINGPVTNLTDHAVWLGTGTTSFGATAGSNPFGKDGIIVVPYSATMAIDASLGKTFTITPNNNTAFTISTPTNPAYNRRLRLKIINTSGAALGAATFTGYKLGAAWTQPATGFFRSLDVEFNGTAWEEVGRTAADVTFP